MLRVHALGFPRRDSEKFRVELVDVVYEGKVSRVGLAGLIGIGVVERVAIPPFGRDRRDSAPTGGQQLPKIIEPNDAAGKA
jgi:hypothetical protein